jgi:hypothetical protein
MLNLLIWHEFIALPDTIILLRLWGTQMQLICTVWGVIRHRNVLHVAYTFYDAAHVGYYSVCSWARQQHFNASTLQAVLNAIKPKPHYADLLEIFCKLAGWPSLQQIRVKWFEVCRSTYCMLHVWHRFYCQLQSPYLFFSHFPCCLIHLVCLASSVG